MTDDAEELGVQSAAINVSLGEIMRTAAGEDRIAFHSGAATYWFSRSAVEALDRQIKPLSDAGTLVDLIVLVYRSGDPDSAAGVLTHPDASPTAGTVMGFNTATQAGIDHLTAAMEFLGSRYSRPDERHGRAVGFIMGNEVDAQWEWSNSGEKPLDDFLDEYQRALRIGWLATTKYAARARTYVSLTHSWTRPSGANPDETARTRYYAGRDVLDGLAALGARDGDFPWHVAYHPYPQDLFDPTVWDDPDATEDPDAAVVTFRNLDQLTAHLRTPALTHDGHPRRVILSEQGCNTPGGLEGQRLQAACYAYAYYRTRFLPGIDAFILHRHVDHGSEGGLTLGLWTRDPDAPHPAAPLAHKLSWRVLRGIDTRRSLRLTQFALDVIGIHDWAEAIPGFDPAALAQQRLPRPVGSRAGVVTGHRERVLGSGEFAAWSAEHNIAATRSVAGELRVDSTSDAFGKQWRGVGRALSRPVEVGNARWLTARLRFPASGSPGALPGDEAVARLRATTVAGVVAEADARLGTDGRAQTVAADLRGLPRSARLAKVQVWARGAGVSQRATTLALRRVALARRTSRSTGPDLLVRGTITTAPDLASTLALRLSGLGAEGIPGRAVLRSCGGYAVRSRRLDLSRLRRGDVDVVRVPVDVTAGGAHRVCLDVAGTRIVVPVDAPDVVVEDFEDGDASAWVPGDGVSRVAVVSSIANGPGTAYSGSRVLEATGSAADPNLLRSVTRTFAEPLDLSGMDDLSVQLDSYGGATGAVGYIATLVVTAADGTSVRTDLDSFSPDQWNRVPVSLAGWAGRDDVASVTVGMRARGSTLPSWAPRFQVDDLAVHPG